MKSISNEGVSLLHAKLSANLHSVGLECHPFLVDWYNNKVSKHFQLQYEPGTLCFVVISQPSMFEKLFLAFVLNQSSFYEKQSDLLDVCLQEYFKMILDQLENTGEVELLQDYHMTATRRPKILMQTAGHVSGAVRFYQKSDVVKPKWNEDKAIFGVCIHPEFGGWFALRAVFIFKDLYAPDLKSQVPKHPSLAQEDIEELLLLFNDHWRDGRYRDIISSKEKYSDLQILYFGTKPAERKQLLNKIFNQSK